MRLVNINNLKGGEIIAKDILSPTGGILIKNSTRFRSTFKYQLLERNITEIYIDDEFSEGIMPTEVISHQLKQTLNLNLSNQFQSIQDVMAFDFNEVAQITNALMSAIDNKDLIFDVMDLKRNDHYTYSHCLNVAIFSYSLAKKMNVSEDILPDIITGALLHDIGKMIIPKDVLNKAGRLTPEERAILETHSKLGYEFVKDDFSISAICKVIILCHHEREDGMGYPLKKGADLHIAAKIVAVADVFDALISDRPYRSKFPIDIALKFSKQEKLNLEILECLENMIAFYPIGSAVLLSNNCIALVEQNFSDALTCPSVRVVFDCTTRTKEYYKLNLQKEDTIKIIRKVDDIAAMIQ